MQHAISEDIDFVEITQRRPKVWQPVWIAIKQLQPNELDWKGGAGGIQNTAAGTLMEKGYCAGHHPNKVVLGL